MKNIFRILPYTVLIIASALSVSAQTKTTMVIDTPTAFTIARGTYQVSMLAYDEGGAELKTFIGLHDNLYLGLSVDVQHAIGRDKPEPNVPGVIARLKFTDGWPTFPISIACGYDSFYMGSEGRTEDYSNDLNRMIYGPYLAITSPIYLFDSEQYISYGIRVPTQPNYVPDDTSYFLSLDIPLGLSFRLRGEMERVFWNFHRPDEWLYNAGIMYSYLDQLGIEFDIMFQDDHSPNRIIKVVYHGEF